MFKPKIQNAGRSIESLQALRGVAAVLVLLFHVTVNLKTNYSVNFLNGFFEFGNSGVEIFFVLSGFIISYTSAHLIGTGDPKKYVVKRLARVYPIYWVVTTAFLIPAIVFGLHSGFQPTTSGLISTYLLLPFHPMVNGVSWSLSYEIYFYMLFALLIVSRKFYVLFTAVLVGVIAQIAGVYTFADPLFGEFFFSQYVLLFFMGMAVYWLWQRQTFELNARATWVVLMLCIAAYLGYAQYLHHYTYSPIFYGFVSAVFIYFAIRIELSTGFRPSPVLVTLGDASYVLYLIHLPILNLSTKLAARAMSDGRALIAFNCVSAAAIIVLSLIIHKKIERPLNRYIKAKLAF